jgi:hypothetical protein
MDKDDLETSTTSNSPLKKETTDTIIANKETIVSSSSPLSPSLPSSPLTTSSLPSNLLTTKQKLKDFPTTSTLHDVRRQPDTVTSNLYVSNIKTDGYAILVTDCHHVLELPLALLPSNCQKGDLLKFNLKKGPGIVNEYNEKMKTIQEVLKESAS